MKKAGKEKGKISWWELEMTHVKCKRQYMKYVSAGVKMKQVRPVSYTHLDVYKRQGHDTLAYGHYRIPVSYTHLDVYKRQKWNIVL